jgi:hypothetical protein
MNNSYTRYHFLNILTLIELFIDIKNFLFISINVDKDVFISQNVIQYTTKIFIKSIQKYLVEKLNNYEYILHTIKLGIYTYA